MKILMILFALLISVGSFGQEKKKRKAPARKVINFEDQLVEGATKKPDLFYLLQKKRFNYKRLIKLREDFLPEMSATAEEISEETGEN